ncbi:MAG: diaminopimelate epimerase [Ilumatobacteraceae bacterium]|nr:diaminopimelate epimerase [Ilumatobacteraceae bacterium]
MRVSKFDAWGNDFLVLDVAQLRSAGVDEVAVAWPEVSRAWCNRASGVGADGLLLLERIDDVNARMRLHNSDGSTAEMSGNGARCFAHALFRSDAARGERVYRLHTDAGVREVTVGEQDSTSVVATVDMGEVSTIDAPANWAAIGTHPDRPVVHVSVGNPHTVVGVDDVDSVDIGQLGRQVPQVNLEIIAPGPGRNAITMRVHERGAGITQACGTGACASAWAALRWGLVSSTTERVEVTVHMLGGDAVVTLNAPEAGRVALAGPAQYVDSYDASLEAPYSVTAPHNT